MECISWTLKKVPVMCLRILESKRSLLRKQEKIESKAKKEVDFRGSPLTNQKKVTHPAALHIASKNTSPKKPSTNWEFLSMNQPLFSLFGPAINLSLLQHSNI